MTSVGEILSKARLGKKLNLDQVEKATRIRLKFLEAIESDQFDKLPPGTFAKGFIKNYAAYLGLSVEDVMAFYRRQTHEEKAKVIARVDPDTESRKFALTPQLFTASSIALLLVAFFSYLIVSYFRFAGSPSLSVSSPKDNSVVSVDQIKIVGSTDPEAKLVINNQQVSIKDSGGFEVTIPLQPGLNTISVVATNKFDKQSTVTRNVRLEK